MASCVGSTHMLKLRSQQRHTALPQIERFAFTFKLQGEEQLTARRKPAENINTSQLHQHRLSGLGGSGRAE